MSNNAAYAVPPQQVKTTPTSMCLLPPHPGGSVCPIPWLTMNRTFSIKINPPLLRRSLLRPHFLHPASTSRPPQNSCSTIAPNRCSPPDDKNHTLFLQPNPSVMARHPPLRAPHGLRLSPIFHHSQRLPPRTSAERVSRPPSQRRQ